eukprot:1671241-Pleurochrysis_carterae.AAC.1
MASVRRLWQRLGKDVSHVVRRIHLADVDEAMCHVFAHLEIASIDVTRALAGAAVLAELERPGVVD